MKRWIWLGFAVLGLAIAVVLALPSIAGSKWVYQPLVDRLAAEKFKLTIDEVSLGWFRPISFGKIELTSPTTLAARPFSQPSLLEPSLSEPSLSEPSLSEPLLSEPTLLEPTLSEQQLAPVAGQPLLSAEVEAPLVRIDSIRSGRSLLGFLWNGRNLGTVEIVNPNIDVRLLEDGSNLGRLIREITTPRTTSETPAKRSNTPPLMDIQIVVKGFHVTVTEALNDEPIVVVPPFDTTVSYESIDVESQVTIAATKALDQVVITQRLVHLGLAKAVPLLASSTEFDGKISLESGPVTIPLLHPQDTTGNITLTLHSVRTVPTDPTIVGAIDLLGRMFKRQLPHELVFVDGSKINVEIADQNVKHEGVRAGLPQVDQRLQIATSGSVGLVDRTLDLGIEIPVPLEQLARRQSVKQLGVPSITLPISGTLDKPQLDWDLFRQDSSDLLAAMSGALSTEAPLAGNVVGALSEIAEGNADQAIEDGVDLVKEILQRRQQLKQSQENASTEPTENPNPEKSSRPLRDAIKKIFRDR